MTSSSNIKTNSNNKSVTSNNEIGVSNNKKPAKPTKRRVYTDQDKEHAIATYLTCGNLSKTSKLTGVPVSTLRGWLAEIPSAKVQEAREDARAKFVHAAWDAVMDGLATARQRMRFVVEDADKIDRVFQAVCQAKLLERDRAQILKSLTSLSNIGLGEIATFNGVHIDKIRLLLDQPTSIDEQRGQVTQRYEYDITQKIVNDPESRETARDLFRRAINEDLAGGRQE